MKIRAKRQFKGCSVGGLSGRRARLPGPQPPLQLSAIGQGEGKIMKWLGKDSVDQLGGVIQVIYCVQRRVRWERAKQGRKERSRNPGNLRSWPNGRCGSRGHKPVRYSWLYRWAWPRGHRLLFDLDFILSPSRVALIRIPRHSMAAPDVKWPPATHCPISVPNVIPVVQYQRPG